MSAVVIPLRRPADALIAAKRKAAYLQVVGEGYWPKVQPIPEQRDKGAEHDGRNHL